MKRIWIVVLLVIYLGLSACSLADRYEKALSVLRATPTPSLTTLGIPGDRLVQFYVDKGYVIDKNQGVINQNRIVLKSPDGSIMINMSAYQGEVINATIWIPVDPNNILGQQNNKDLIDFMDRLLPDWSGRNAWLQQTIRDASSNFKDGTGEYYTIYDGPGAELELSASSNARNIVLLIFARQASN